jgi:hypothetical protein
MFFIIVTKLLQLRIPYFLVRFVLDIDLKTNFVEPSFSFQIHFAVFEVSTLIADPNAQLWVVNVRLWHFSYMSGGETGGMLVGVFKMKENGRQRKTTYSDHAFHNSPAAS